MPHAERLPDIDAVDPVGEQDHAVFQEVREVLERHGALKRFGLYLLHEHFDIAEDEAMVEFIDRENRKLVTVPVPVEKLANVTRVETSWRLDNNKATGECAQTCVREDDGSHTVTGHLPW